MTGEFDIIGRIRQRSAAADDSVLLGIGDDAAVLAVTEGMQLVVTTDSLNQGVHFAVNDEPAKVGHKALAVSLSDLAAMGAQPRWALLNLGLPLGDEGWVDDFADGFLALAEASQVNLVGGDTTLGPLSVTVTLLGEVPPGQALRRSGASPGDRIFVSGCPGLAALALRERLAGRVPALDAQAALDLPVPRVALGIALRGLATACIDVSDGLLADLGHITQASACGADLKLAQLPGHPELDVLGDRERWDLQLGGGDDYELCFCLAPGDRERVLALSRRLDVRLTEVGEVTADPDVRCRLADDSLFQPSRTGYEHFARGTVS